MNDSLKRANCKANLFFSIFSLVSDLKRKKKKKDAITIVQTNQLPSYNIDHMQNFSLNS